MLNIRSLRDAEAFEMAVLSEEDARKYIKSLDPFEGNARLNEEMMGICRAYVKVGFSQEAQDAVYKFRLSLSLNDIEGDDRDLKKLPIGSLKQYRMLQQYRVFKEQREQYISNQPPFGEIRIVFSDNIWRVKFLQELCDCYEQCKSKQAAKNFILRSIKANIIKEELSWHSLNISSASFDVYGNKVIPLY